MVEWSDEHSDEVHFVLGALGTVAVAASVSGINHSWAPGDAKSVDDVPTTGLSLKLTMVSVA